MVKIAWGARVSRTFLDRVIWIVKDLQIGSNTADGVNKLMTCMAWESGRSFDPGKKNLAGSGATGLIQFMPATAKSLGTTTAALAKMTPEDQLNYVWKYFADYKGKLKTLGDLYMAILWPKGVGKADTFVLWDKATQPTTFRQNAGLDKNHDGKVTKGETTAKVAALLDEGLLPPNVLVSADQPTPAPSPPSTLLGVHIDAGEILERMKDNAAKVAVDTAADVVTEVAASAVTRETPEATTTATVEPKTTTVLVAKAISGWQGNWAGIATIAGALLLNPDFAAKLGGFTVALAKGEASWGAVAALIGFGLIAYKHRPAPE